MTFINSHGDAALVAFYFFSAIVSGMPEPVATSGTAYRWAYSSLHVLAGDLSQIIGSRTVQP